MIMDHNENYFVRNTFICTWDELYIDNTKRSKSLSNLPILKDNIELYTYQKKIYNHLRHIIIDIIGEPLNVWKECITSTLNTTIEYYNNLLLENNSKLVIYKNLSDFVNKKNIKNMLKYFKEIKEKLETNLSNNEISDLINEIIDFSKILENEQKTQKNNNIISNNLIIENKLFEIQKKLVDIDHKYISPQLKILFEMKKYIITCIGHLKKTFKTYFKIIEKQVTKFINTQIMNIMVLYNWKINDVIHYYINSVLILGDDIWGKLIYNINIPYIF
jgi:hypothetical protein